MPPQRDLKALAKAAGITKQQYVDQESRARRKANKDGAGGEEVPPQFQEGGLLGLGLDHLDG